MKLLALFALTVFVAYASGAVTTKAPAPTTKAAPTTKGSPGSSK